MSDIRRSWEYYVVPLLLGLSVFTPGQSYSGWILGSSDAGLYLWMVSPLLMGEGLSAHYLLLPLGAILMFMNFFRLATLCGIISFAPLMWWWFEMDGSTGLKLHLILLSSAALALSAFSILEHLESNKAPGVKYFGD
jgi:hypothetical protein